jgi:hypothetical protein
MLFAVPAIQMFPVVGAVIVALPFTLKSAAEASNTSAFAASSTFTRISVSIISGTDQLQLNAPAFTATVSQPFIALLYVEPPLVE